MYGFPFSFNSVLGVNKYIFSFYFKSVRTKFHAKKQNKPEHLISNNRAIRYQKINAINSMLLR